MFPVIQWLFGMFGSRGRVAAAGTWGAPDRSAKWATDMTATNQTLKKFYTGEDVVYPLAGTSTTDPTAWTVRFTLVPFGGGSPVVVTGAITRTVTGVSPNFSCTFSVPLTHSQTVNLTAGVAGWQFDRTDSGSEQVLAEGTVEVLAPRAPLP